jgi:hypothetical protein
MGAPNILRLSHWETPASRYPMKRTGTAALTDFTYGAGTYDCYGIHGYDQFEVIGSIRVRNLRIKGRTVMVDDPPHWWAMQDHAKHYHGHVVCAGLGLGLIVHALARNQRVRQITVVEQNTDVIKMVKPLLPRCKIVHADFNTWSPACQMDGLFYDLFVGNGRELLGRAIEVFTKLVLDFPAADPIRIHGFNNRCLADLRQALEQTLPRKRERNIRSARVTNGRR